MSNFFDARWLAWPRKFAGPGVGIPGNGLGTEDTIYFNNQIQGLWYVSLSLCLFVFLSLCLFVSLSLCSLCLFVSLFFLSFCLFVLFVSLFSLSLCLFVSLFTVTSKRHTSCVAPYSYV